MGKHKRKHSTPLRLQPSYTTNDEIATAFFNRLNQLDGIAPPSPRTTQTTNGVSPEANLSSAGSELVLSSTPSSFLEKIKFKTKPNNFANLFEFFNRQRRATFFNHSTIPHTVSLLSLNEPLEQDNENKTIDTLDDQLRFLERTTFPGETTLRPLITQFINEVKRLQGQEPADVLAEAVTLTKCLLQQEHPSTADIEAYKAKAQQMPGHSRTGLMILGGIMLMIGCTLALAVAASLGGLLALPTATTVAEVSAASVSSLFVGGYSLFAGGRSSLSDEMYQISDMKEATHGHGA